MILFAKLVDIVTGIWGVIHAVFGGIFVMIDKYKIVRRLSFITSWYLVFWVIAKSFSAAEAANYNPAVIGALIAFLAPVSALHAAGLKFYSDLRKEEKEEKNNI